MEAREMKIWWNDGHRGHTSMCDVVWSLLLLWSIILHSPSLSDHNPVAFHLTTTPPLESLPSLVLISAHFDDMCLCQHLQKQNLGYKELQDYLEDTYAIFLMSAQNILF